MTAGRRGSWAPTLLVIGGLALVGGALLLVPPMLAPSQPSANPGQSAPVETPTPSPLPAPSLPVSAYRSVEWARADLPDPGFEFSRSAVVGERLVVLGASRGAAAGWFSDDGGDSWEPAAVPAQAGGPATTLPYVNQLAATDRQLLALGWWVDEVAGTGDEPFAWTSRDGGSSWQAASLPTAEGSLQLIDLAGAGDRFIGYGYEFGSSGRTSWWASADGEAWAPLEVSGLELSDRLLPALASGPGGLVAAGSDADRPPTHPAAWFSANGEDWTPTLFGVAEVGALHLATASAQGYLVAGQTGPDERTLSQQGIPTVWISPDGLRWSGVAFTDQPGAQVGAAALNAAGAVLVMARLTSGTEVPTSTTVRFLRGGTNETVDEELPLIVHQAMALPERFVVIGSCPAPASADCSGAALFVGRPVR